MKENMFSSLSNGNVNHKSLLTTFVVIFASACVIYMLLSLLAPYENVTISYKYESAEKIRKNCRPWILWSEMYRKCLSDYLKTLHSWHHMHRAVAHCLGQSTFDMLNMKLLDNWDDTKVVIPPYTNDTPCTALSLGIGNDINAEIQLLHLVPHCQLFGADPILKSGKIFENIGKYYEVAVSGHNGIFNSIVLEDKHYFSKEVSNIAFVDFILNNVSRTTFDYFFLDNEGPEYEILPMLFRGGLIEKNEVIICQISVELHGPVESYGSNYTSYDRLLKDLIEFSPFVPLWCAEPHLHSRMYLFNAKHEYCIQQFLQPFCHSEN